MPGIRLSEHSASRSVILSGGIVLVLLFAKVLLIPIAFALALCFLLLPAVLLFERRMRRSVAVVLVCLLTFLCLGVGSYSLSRQVIHVAQELPGYSEHIQSEIESVQSPSVTAMKDAVTIVENYGRYLTSDSGREVINATPVRVVGGRSDGLRSTAQLMGSILEPLGQLGIVVIFTIYMLINREDLRHRLLLLAGMGQLNSMTRAMGDAASRISKYLVMQVQVNACYGILFGIGLHFLGVPEAALWGVIAGVLRIVPFVGALSATIFPLVLSIAVSTGWLHPILVVALFLGLELMIANVVEPWLFSSRTGISGLALLASAIFWSMLWGWPGLILSTPLTVCVVVMGRYVPQFSFLHSLLGKDVHLSPAAHIYERLLAMDQVEAWAIAERYLDGKPLVDLYDTVVIPVLSLAEEDKHKGALTPVQSKFVRLSMGELVARLTEYVQVKGSGQDKTTGPFVLEARWAESQKEIAVICISAGDKANELATVMLTQLLERSGCQTILLNQEAMSEEILRALAAEKQTVVVISALPPFAFSQARALCQRVRQQMPENRVAVALWNSDEDAEEMLARFGPARPDALVGTLAAAVAQVSGWQRASRRA